ncbi:MAG: hypothetical protein ABJC66_17310 [Gammaproteobacteria bacterium]
MSDRAQSMDDATLQAGLLMESAQVHQKSAEEQLEKLRLHVQDIDGVVRDEIRRTLIEELQMLSAESKRATDALQKIKRAASLRATLWTVLMAVLSTGIPLVVMGWTLPTGPEIAALRARRDELAASVATLERRGGRIEWRRCGATARLCVRVDRGASAYGEKADYYIVAGL